eukprot:9042271-Lingulodinium_polyedra.AAC.1
MVAADAAAAAGAAFLRNGPGTKLWLAGLWRQRVAANTTTPVASALTVRERPMASLYGSTGGRGYTRCCPVPVNPSSHASATDRRMLVETGSDTRIGVSREFDVGYARLGSSWNLSGRESANTADACVRPHGLSEHANTRTELHPSSANTQTQPNTGSLS